MFDAGAIQAHLDVDMTLFDRRLADAKAEVKRFEDEPHRIKIDAHFDDASVGRARSLFANLDNQLSRDAANRLRSSPQGSVLGALNALLSPHPVSGSPSASQSASQGLLGKIISAPAAEQPGSAGGSGSGSDGSQGRMLANAVSGGNATESVRQVLTGGSPGAGEATQDVREQLVGGQPTPGPVTEQVKEQLEGQGPQNVTTTDYVKQDVEGQGPQDVTTTDTVKERVVGQGPQNTTTTDTVREKLDKKSTDDVEKGAADSGDRAGGRWTVGFGGHLGPFFAMFKKQLGGAGEEGGDSMAAGLLGGIGPGILGIGTMFATKFIGGVGTILAAAPALLGTIGTGMGVAMIGGLVYGAVKTSPKLTAQLKSIGGDASKMFTQAVAPLVPYLAKVFAQLPPLIKAVEPELQAVSKIVGPQLMGILNNLAGVIGGLVGILKAAAPAFGPFVEAIEGLVANLLPGIAMAIKATVPFIGQLGKILGQLGSNLGGLFAQAAPAIGASMKVLGDLLGVIGGLLPVIAKLGGMFATTLAPVFGDLGQAIIALEPTIKTIGGVLADLAGAVLGDLGSAFGALAEFVQAAGPGINILAKAFGSLFSVLENAGVFAEMGDALENLAPALGKLVTLLITDIAPVLPQVVGLFSQMLNVIVDLASSGLGVVIKGFTDLIDAIPPGVLQAIVGGLIGIKLAMIGMEGASAIFGLIETGVVAMTGGISTAIGVIQAMVAAVDFDTIALKAMYAWDAIITVATKAWAVAQGILDAVMDASPIVLITLAVVALGVAVYELVTHWSTVWSAIKSTADTVWQWLLSNVLDPMKDFFTVTIPGWWNTFVDLFQQDFATPIEDGFKAVWDWLNNNIFNPMETFFLTTIPGWWNTFVNLLTSVFVTPVENAFKTAWSTISTAVQTAWNAIATFFSTWWNTQETDVSKALSAVGTALSKAWTDITTALKTAWNAISTWFGSWWSTLETDFGKALSTVETALSKAWDTVTTALKTAWNAVSTWLSTWWGTLNTDFGKALSTVESTLSTAWGDVYKAVQTAWGKITGFFDSVNNTILKALSGLKDSLTSWAKDAMNGMLDGFEDIWKDVVSFFDGLTKDILHALGINSPPQWAIDAGKHIMNGIGIGMSQAQSAATKAAALVVSGTTQHLSGAAGQIQALMKSMAAGYGWTGQLWNDLNAVEMKEAGYNPNAQNPSSGAYGLAQFINGPSEYAEYGGNANTIAGQITGMLNYIAQRYGNPANAWLHEQAFNWYGSGGPITEPVIGYGVNSGRGYVFGERGPEYVTPGIRGGGASDPALLDRLDQLIAATRQIPQATGNQVGGVIGGASYAASFRSRYPRGGA